MTVTRTWTCKCGEIKANLKGEPVLNFRCHCHSCVAAARFIEEKTEGKGTSILHPDGGGACASPYAGHQVHFCTPLSTEEGKSKLKFVRYENGKAWRCYTTCCGSQMTNCIFPGLVVFNRNGIKNADGTPYEPPHEVLNIQKANAFDPEAVPEPSHNTGPTSYTYKFLWPVVNPFSKKIKTSELFPDSSEAAIVPMTW